jgi:hypothetical protein
MQSSVNRVSQFLNLKLVRKEESLYPFEMYWSTSRLQIKLHFERLVTFYSGHILEKNTSTTADEHWNTYLYVFTVAYTGETEHVSSEYSFVPYSSLRFFINAPKIVVEL